MTKLRYTQGYLGVLLCTLFIALLGLNIASSYLLIALSLAVIILGLPHGALDFAVAKSLGLVDSPNSALYFVTGYIALSALAIVFWIVYPVFGLALFLTISIYHFSTDWRSIMPSYASIGLAAVIICGSAIFYSATLLRLFTALLLSPKSAAWIIQSMKLIFAAGLTMFLYFVFHAVQNKQRDKLKVRQQYKQTVSKWFYAEWIALIISSLVLSPLLHFALYFCLLHSPKHLQDVSATLDVSVGKAIIVSLPFVLLTLLFAVVLFKLVGTSTLDITLLRWIFIGLFGLTISHMLLITLWHQEA